MNGEERNATGERQPPSVSFEFFPPKTPAQSAVLTATVARLRRLRPAFVSVTYGAGGTTRERSLAAVRDMIAEAGLPTAAHLTCVGASRDQLDDAIAAFLAAGVRRFVALRGDPEGGLAQPYRPHPDGYHDTAQLVRRMKEHGAADVSVSAYPERHPHSRDWASEIDVLKRKVDAGADRAITQFFFDNDAFERYVERVRAAGIGVPVVPGIMPINDFAALCNFASRCGAHVPQRLARRFDGLDSGSDLHRQTAEAVAAEQIADLLARGVDSFHIYTLNRSDLPEAICSFLGIRPEGERDAA